MLTYENEPTIRFALLRRLDQEPGVKVCEIKVIPHLTEQPPFIAVGVLVKLGELLTTRSIFHLPAEFDHRHLVNEIDEIAEQYRAARKAYFRNGMVMTTPEKQLLGNGLRGNWAKYG